MPKKPQRKDASDFILYFFDEGKIIVVTNGFVKKKQKTPKGEIELAKKRRREYHLRKEAGIYE